MKSNTTSVSVLNGSDKKPQFSVSVPSQH